MLAHGLSFVSYGLFDMPNRFTSFVRERLKMPVITWTVRDQPAVDADLALCRPDDLRRIRADAADNCVRVELRTGAWLASAARARYLDEHDGPRREGGADPADGAYAIRIAASIGAFTRERMGQLSPEPRAAMTGPATIRSCPTIF